MTLGKSAEVSLSPRNHDYGKWAVDVINGLVFNEMSCFGGSFGAGILVKAMCIAPEVIKRSYGNLTQTHGRGSVYF